MTGFDPAADDVSAYWLLTAIVVPRPIAWISTLSAAGERNLAPHSFFTVASADPPMVSFTSVGRKDTLRNVLETEEFTISLASAPMLDLINDTSAPFAHGTDESEAAGIEMAPAVRVSPSRVARSPAALECRLHSTVDLGRSVVVLGEVVWITVADEVLVDGRPSYELMAPVARLGGRDWGLPGEVVSRTRPQRPEDGGR